MLAAALQRSFGLVPIAKQCVLKGRRECGRSRGWRSRRAPPPPLPPSSLPLPLRVPPLSLPRSAPFVASPSGLFPPGRVGGRCEPGRPPPKAAAEAAPLSHGDLDAACEPRPRHSGWGRRGFQAKIGRRPPEGGAAALGAPRRQMSAQGRMGAQSARLFCSHSDHLKRLRPRFRVVQGN